MTDTKDTEGWKPEAEAEIEHRAMQEHDLIDALTERLSPYDLRFMGTRAVVMRVLAEYRVLSTSPAPQGEGAGSIPEQLRAAAQRHLDCAAAAKANESGWFDTCPPEVISTATVNGHHLLRAADLMEQAAETDEQLIARLSGWRDMATAPRDETQILLLSRIHGVTEARWGPGEWSEDTPISPREYSGAVWVCGDDQWQIEVEEIGPNEYHDGEAIGWLPRGALPSAEHLSEAATKPADPQDEPPKAPAPEREGAP